MGPTVRERRQAYPRSVLALIAGPLAARLPAALGAPLLALLVLLAPPVTAQSVVNGDMDGVADVQDFNAVTPPGWTGNVFGGTDLWDGTTTISGSTWDFSTGGGTFVHGSGVFLGTEFVEQDLDGLVVGGQYEVTFEQSITDTLFGARDVGGYWQVTFGADVLDSPFMPTPAFGVPAPWQFETLVFTAATGTQTLRFNAFAVTPPPTTWRADIGLDTVSVSQVGLAGAPQQWVYTVDDQNVLRAVDIEAGCVVTTVGVTQDTPSGPVRKVRGLVYVPSLQSLVGITREGDVVRVDQHTAQTALITTLPFGDPTTESWGGLAFDGVETLYTANAFDGLELVALKLPAFTTNLVGSTLTAGGQPRQVLGLDFYPPTAPPSGLPDPVPGVLYGAERSTGSVVRVDVNTAVVTDVGGGLGVAAPQQLAFHPYSGTLFGLDCQGTGAADLTTYDFAALQGNAHCALPFEIVEQGFFPDFGWGGLAFARPGVFSNQGCALAGVSGDPLLAAAGTLVAGTTNTLTLGDAAPSAFSLLFPAVQSNPVPFFGGTLKPVPFLNPIPLTTTPAGGFVLPFVLPPGVPAGTEIWLQWAIADVAAINGVSLSNAVVGVTP